MDRDRKGRNSKRERRLWGLPDLLWQERVPAQALGERFGVDAEGRSDSDGGDDAGVDISVDARSAEAEEPSYLGNRQRSLDPPDLVGKGQRWVNRISHSIYDDSGRVKLTLIVWPVLVRADGVRDLGGM
jgi:hypothetical protein